MDLLTTIKHLPFAVNNSVALACPLIPGLILEVAASKAMLKRILRPPLGLVGKCNVINK